eukprot:TRINITY_DN11316_c0_g1_i17.p1 TRINITY_DN11316_c0_g1~~TRINITY_DN11316_c0_g1_i17.p1  ORF type:complete len:147 (-),score=19.62 TRINITY_DN11316_c0_g1_i17:610-1050(-)
MAVPLIMLPRYNQTPIELLASDKKEECKSELDKMYANTEDAQRRCQDISNVMELTDKYRVSIFRLICFPPNYRNALIIGIIVGMSQGVINVFFEGFLCQLVNNEVTSSYCKQTLYNPTSSFSYMLFLNALAVAPTLSFVYYFECNI